MLREPDFYLDIPYEEAAKARESAQVHFELLKGIFFELDKGPNKLNKQKILEYSNVVSRHSHFRNTHPYRLSRLIIDEELGIDVQNNSLLQELWDRFSTVDMRIALDWPISVDVNLKTIISIATEIVIRDTDLFTNAAVKPAKLDLPSFIYGVDRLLLSHGYKNEDLLGLIRQYDPNYIRDISMKR